MVRTKRSAAEVPKGEAEREKAIRIHSNSLACEVISIKRQQGTRKREETGSEREKKGGQKITELDHLLKASEWRGDDGTAHQRHPIPMNTTSISRERVSHIYAG